MLSRGKLKKGITLCLTVLLGMVSLSFLLAVINPVQGASLEAIAAYPGLMGSFDITEMEPTQREEEAILEAKIRSYTRFKRSVFEVPELIGILDKHMG